jgi:hypothetical protein
MVGPASDPNRSAERLAYWYFRLNGFLTIENFLVHPNSGPNPVSEIDVIGVRLPHRRENSERPMADELKIEGDCNLADVVLVDACVSYCKVSDRWLEPEKRVFEHVLRAIGPVADDELEPACQALRSWGSWAGEFASIRLIGVGKTKNPFRTFPCVELTWDELIEFCISRLRTYRVPKSSSGQWTADGRLLQMWSERGNRDAIKRYFNLVDAE